jgi:phenylacetate-CoA ligase
MIGRLDPVFKTQIPLREAQIVQETLTKVRVRYVPAAGFDNDSERSIISRIRERMGPVEVILEQLEQIPRERNGKFRAVKCNLSLEELKSQIPSFSDGALLGLRDND